MFRFTQEEWNLLSETDFQAAAQSSLGPADLPLTPKEVTQYYQETPDHEFSDEVLEKICQRFTLEVSDFEDADYYAACTGLNWDAAQALIAKMQVYLKKSGYSLG